MSATPEAILSKFGPEATGLTQEWIHETTEIMLDAPPDPFNPPEQIATRVEVQLREAAAELAKSMEQGYKLLVGHYMDCAIENLEAFPLEHLWELDKIADVDPNKIGVKSEGEAYVTIQESAGISAKALGSYKDVAQKLFEAGEYEDCLTLVSYLIRIAPFEADLWLSQGGIQYELGAYESAATSFEQAALIEPDSVLPYFHLAHAHQKLGNPMLALEFADYVLLRLSSPDHDSFRAEVEEFKQQFSA